MCGLAGIVNFNHPHANFKTRLPTMLAAQRHRGPDGCGFKYYGSAALAHTRLALIDLAGGDQPFISRDQRYCLVYNGEIYNFAELRRELAPLWSFATESDTEVVLAAYVCWGERALHRFNGMFAFFIWDEQLKQGFAARDLLGVKPFAYQYQHGELLFGSEAKAIVAVAQTPVKADADAILEYLVAPYFSGVESSMFAGIEYLQPGHCLHIDSNGLVIRQWRDYQLTAEITPEQNVEDELSHLLGKAVNRAMRADVPVATYLSGGLDSTLISAIANKAAPQPLACFSIRFADHGKIDYANSLIVSSDDMPFARSAAQEIGLRQQIVDVDEQQIAKSFSELTAVNDALPAWEQEFAQFHLARVAGAQFKAVLVGDAADEIHWGYPFLLDQAATYSPAGILARFSLPKLAQGSAQELTQMFNDKYQRLAGSAGYGWHSATERSLATAYLVVKRWLPRLLHNGDIHAMRHSLEARVPFADIELLDFARKIHPELGYRQGCEKWLLRQGSRGLLPEQVRTRPKSALPKAQSIGLVYQRLARTALQTSAEFIGHFLELAPLLSLSTQREPLTEMERALLFRVISLSYWQQRYKVVI
ncbi:asparagine synthase (glutamine-hydrolyzing) [Corallincola holothuriorum]|uniref:asparagine synthase (glutamine-hydrolyzing) n=1 Tax=Corallincola holothuriorum TaxID=2282215 RepID=A0A368NQT0_9GAMM|nr:asparagine synthase (glutamine-hydrolyzing) [Corallincola holothuriorum]RCU52927.1 asparagine synthase (glutamine-hydrolyzing) [Corallincola holothuriorum]